MGSQLVRFFSHYRTHIVTPSPETTLVPSYHCITHFHIYSNSVLSFAVDSLKVKHVIVLGHYGCGGVAAAMMPLGKLPTRPADIAIQSWISPIRDIYETSERYASTVEKDGRHLLATDQEGDHFIPRKV